MMKINNKTLRDANWRQVYRYTGDKVSFITYACDTIPGLTITKDLRGAKVVKTSYTVGGKISDSPTQAVRDYNAEEKRKRGGSQAPGSAETTAARKAISL